jgi:RNA 2',3'-cyclic 3'-phosphodiesterase
MRLFCGIDLPEDVRERMERLLMHLRPSAHLKWVTVYNLHLTLKFIGEWPEEKLATLETALRSIQKRPVIPLEVRGLGWYPNPRNPRVFWAAVEGGEALPSLAHDIQAALEPLGIAKETRTFTAHLTLARIKEPAPLDALRNAVTQMGAAEFGSFSVDRFHLFRSQPGSAGSIYTKLSEFPFHAE